LGEDILSASVQNGKANGPFVKIMESAIDGRINPIEILRLDQLSARVPVSASCAAARQRSDSWNCSGRVASAYQLRIPCWSL